MGPARPSPGPAQLALGPAQARLGRLAQNGPRGSWPMDGSDQTSLDPSLTTLSHPPYTRTTTRGPGPRARKASSPHAQTRLHTPPATTLPAARPGPAIPWFTARDPHSTVLAPACLNLAVDVTHARLLSIRTHINANAAFKQPSSCQSSKRESLRVCQDINTSTGIARGDPRP